MHSIIVSVGHITYPTMKAFSTNIHISIKKANEILVNLAGSIINTVGRNSAKHRQNTHSFKTMQK